MAVASRCIEAIRDGLFCNFANGDILELGTYQGLSTCIMAQAVIDSKRNAKIVAVDIWDYGWVNNAAQTGVAGVIDFRLGDAAQKVNELTMAKRKFGFTFVDHSHAYVDVAKRAPFCRTY